MGIERTSDRRRISRRTALKGGAIGLSAFTLACSSSSNNGNNNGGNSNKSSSGTAAGGPSTAATSAAASRTGTPGAAVGGAATTSASGAPVRGGTLRFVLPYNMTSLDPAFSTNANDPTAYRGLFDSLFAFDAKGNLLPYLVDKWEIPGDGLTWTLHLHPGVKFHDGTPLNAAAVKTNLDRVIDPNSKSPQRGDLAQIASTQVTDDTTVVLKLSTPYSPLGFNLAGRAGMIFSPAALQKFGADTRTNPVGSGPFKFGEFQSDSRLTLTKNADYWRMGADGKMLPYLDGINIIINTDPTAQYALLRSGQTDMLFQVDNLTAQQFKTDSNLVLLKGRSTPTGITMNMNRRDKPSPLSDIRLRQAVAMAIDPAAVIKVALGGDGTASPPQNFWYPEHWASYTDQVSIKRDLQQVKQLMTAAGQPNGFEFSYMAIKGNTTQNLDVLQASLMEAGIKMNYDIQEVGIYADRNMKGQWDAGGSAGNIFSVDPGPSLRRYFWSESGCAPGGTGVFGGGVFSGSGFSDCQFDQDMVKGESTTDIAERTKIYQEMNALWAKAWHTPKNYLVPVYAAARKNVRNAALYGDSIPQFHDAWLTT